MQSAAALNPRETLNFQKQQGKIASDQIEVQFNLGYSNC